ncbi:MAG TPA: hypothetical protein VJB57_17415 [Dehalococcoidia bacterium]|nr:hypothetical protein [Dehalococcoidia bacterium]
MFSLARLAQVLGGALTALVLLSVACGDDDDVSISGSASVSASGEPPAAGVVEVKPASAAQVDVILQEWAVRPQQTSVRAGQVYFLVDNQGPEDPHELVIIQSDLAPDKLPLEKDKVPENKVKIIGEIEPFAPKSKAGKTFNLPAGKYVLICNITEVEDGKVESHYKLGMRAAFTVQ